MPNYTFEDKNGIQFTKFLKLDELDSYKKEHPNINQIPTSIPVGQSERMMNRNKPDDGFRDILRQMKKDHMHSNINTHD